MYTMCGEWGDEYLFLYLDRGYNFNNELFELLLWQMWFTGSKKGETEKSYQRDGDFNATSVQVSSRFDHCDESHNESVPLYIKHCIKISLVSHLNFLISRLE